ncbi:hypothetical protein KUCAC02_012652 [Chaenocephalus aceratus]|uniref:Uncharacterized protein n=1 Tax=Chaenocephalus aceratus TaxID=36190 RepID=A0ACB9XD95_CHAAC|nr:hypothetical protein KUCAC02_012652 [Chaenocephalus aceratus]
MGNTESVSVQKRLSRFRPEERPVVEGVFDKLQGGGAPSGAPGKTPAGSTLTLEMLQSSMGSVAPESMVAEFLEDLISTVVQIVVHRGRLQAWQPERMGDGSLGVKLLAEHLCSELKPSDQGCDDSCLEDWIFRTPQVSLYLEMLVSEGLDVSLSGRPAPTLLPPCRDTPWKDLRCLLDLPSLMFLAPQLPDSYSAPWRLVFSTQLHGESFSRMVTGLTKCGPTLLLIRDTKGHIFGGFASHAWELRPKFQGDSRCFLFTVFPRLRVYTATGYNEHFMYLNQNQQTMPNGLGMGGQHGYFGLWLDSDFGRGHSRARPRCTTYGSPQLSEEEDFRLDSVEVWAVGSPQSHRSHNMQRLMLWVGTGGAAAGPSAGGGGADRGWGTDVGVRQTQAHTEHQASIAEHQASIAEHQASIAEHQASIAEHQASIAEHQASIAEHQAWPLWASIEEHQASIAEHQPVTAGTTYRASGEEGQGKRSILDMDPEAQAMMEMTGKTLHSQGLREPEEDQEQ